MSSTEVESERHHATDDQIAVTIVSVPRDGGCRKTLWRSGDQD